MGQTEISQTHLRAGGSLKAWSTPVVHHRCWRGRFAFREETAASRKRDGTTGHGERTRRCPRCCNSNTAQHRLLSITTGRFLHHPRPRNLLPGQSHQVHPHPAPPQLPGGSGVPSPFVLTGHVTSCGLRCPTVTPSTGHSLPSSGQPRSAKVRALREGQAGTSPSLAAAGRQEGQHQQHRSSRARPVSNRQQPPGTHSATGPACPKPTDSSAQRGQHTQSSGGCGIHPADFYLFKLL